jgi:UDP-N-acetylglucosamine diphosphorylase / glucose-1-phosphate thymidylyltransferase / UDP-N-acetylgalactosamine diphosphorylase / glucosamine-1-phosphate N-acetyltransferase / galactosamine-1-phosphate N-acetyltransferase
VINIVIPMAGEGSRFVKAGYTKPKPFIDVDGKAMIQRVLENLAYPNARYLLIARSEHIESERELVQEIEQEFNATFIPIEHLTEGTACTVLFVHRYISNEDPLLIANSDQIVDMDISKFIDDCMERNLDGSILTFVDKYKDPKWSFAKIDEKGLLTEVQEKKAISEYATVGIYLFRKGRDFVQSAIDMIVENERVNQEFYTCPTYNYVLRQGKSIGIYNIPQDSMHGLGTPEDLNLFLQKKMLTV